MEFLHCRNLLRSVNMVNSPACHVHAIGGVVGQTLRACLSLTYKIDLPLGGPLTPQRAFKFDSPLAAKSEIEDLGDSYFYISTWTFNFKRPNLRTSPSFTT